MQKLHRLLADYFYENSAVQENQHGVFVYNGFSLLMLVMLFLTVIFLQCFYFLFTNLVDILGNLSCSL